VYVLFSPDSYSLISNVILNIVVNGPVGVLDNPNLCYWNSLNISALHGSSEFATNSVVQVAAKCNNKRDAIKFKLNTWKTLKLLDDY